MSKDITIRVIVESNGNGNGTSSPLVCIEDEGEIIRLREIIKHNDAVMTSGRNQIQSLLAQREGNLRALNSKDQSIKTMQSTIDRLQNEIELLSTEISRLRAKLGMKAGEM